MKIIKNKQTVIPMSRNFRERAINKDGGEKYPKTLKILVLLSFTTLFLLLAAVLVICFELSNLGGDIEEVPAQLIDENITCTSAKCYESLEHAQAEKLLFLPPK